MNTEIKETVNQIKNDYFNINEQLNELHEKQRQLSKQVEEILKNENDINERTKIIDFVYANGVEEIHEYVYRKLYL